MPSRALTLTAILTMATLPALVHAGCKDDWMCVDEISKDGDLILLARNLREFPITYTLRVRARNYSVAGPNTVTRRRPSSCRRRSTVVTEPATTGRFPRASRACPGASARIR